MREMDGMKCWLGYDHIEKGDAVGLYNEEEKLLERDMEKGRSEHCIVGIGPYASTYQVGIPWDGGCYGDL